MKVQGLSTENVTLLPKSGMQIKFSITIYFAPQGSILYSLFFIIYIDIFLFFFSFLSFIFLCNILITSAKKRDKVIIAITSSNFVFFSLFGCTTRIYFMLSLFFLIYINIFRFFFSFLLLIFYYNLFFPL